MVSGCSLYKRVTKHGSYFSHYVSSVFFFVCRTEGGVHYDETDHSVTTPTIMWVKVCERILVQQVGLTW